MLPPRAFTHAQARAAMIAAHVERFIKKHWTATPQELALAFALIATKIDTRKSIDTEKPERDVRDFLILACGGVESLDWSKLRGLNAEITAAQDAPDVLRTDGTSDTIVLTVSEMQDDADGGPSYGGMMPGASGG